MKLKYVANQLTPEGLDEIQRIILAYKLGQHVALSGFPGVGKTDLVMNIPKIVERPIFGTTCDSYMTESPLVGFPELEGQNGSTVTVWKNGFASQAAEENGIFYGDEFDLLPGSVQKRLNSLFDDRRNISRRDGKIISAGDSFMGIISYNPGDKLSKRELEEAVADRFVHLSFRYLPPQLEAASALKDTSRLSLEERAILISSDRIRFLTKDEKNWKDIFTGERVTHTEGAAIYDALNPYAIAPILDVSPAGVKKTNVTPKQEVLPQRLSKYDLANRIADYFVSIRTFADQGTNKLPDAIKQYLSDIGEVTNVPLHKPSTRILKGALAQYSTLVELGMKPEQAQAYATRLCIDQICYGKFGQRSLGKVTVQDAVSSMAQFYNLLGKPKQRTDFKT